MIARDRPRYPAIRILAAVLLLAAATGSVAHASPGGTNLLNDTWWVRSSLNARTASNKVGLARPEDMTYVFCYRDASTASGRVHDHGEGSSRWFLIWFQSVDPHRREDPRVGFVSTLAIDRPKQPRVPRCVRRPEWPQRLGPPGDEVPPGEIIYGYPDEAADGNTGSVNQDVPPQQSTPTPDPTYGETTGGVAHTWSDPANAGGTAGPSIPAHATVQVACKLQGFRVADGNTWWYRVAQQPWGNQYFVSADAFYNNGATSGSLRGTPFVDPAVRDC